VIYREFTSRKEREPKKQNVIDVLNTAKRSN